MMENDYYKLLDISRSADKAELKRAYYAQVKIYTPEKDPERFKALREAYEFLSDDKKRAEYDKYADLPEKTAAAAREAKRLMDNAQYAEAIELLKKRDKKDALKPLLIQAYLANGNSGMAVKLCETLIKRKPADPGIYIWLAKSYRERGYNNKALETVETAVELFPDNVEVLDEYLKAYYNITESLPNEYFYKLKRIADKMAAYNYLMFRVCIECEMPDDKMDRVPFLYAHYADGIMSAKTVTPLEYENAISMTYELVFQEDECVETAKRLAPFLNNHKFRNDQKEKLDKLGNMLGLYELRGKIDSRLIDYLAFLTDEPEMDISGEEKFNHEYNMVQEAEELRASLIKLRDYYPKFFNMSKAFFLDLMNPTMYKKLRSRYEKKLKEGFPADIDKLNDLMRQLTSEFESASDDKKKEYRGEFKKLKELFDRIKKSGAADDYLFGKGSRGGFDDYDDADEDDDIDDGYDDAGTPFVHADRKVGRNDPCPCGSGKKYKQCCGRAKAANA